MHRDANAGGAQFVAPELASVLRNARAVAVLTGAGVSAESGVPTFRDAQTGLWAKYDPRSLATPTAFAADPQRVWDWYAWRRSLVAAVRPNPAHYALVAMEQRVPRFTLITQNVDGLHARAGSTRLVELHGNLARVKCSREHVVVAQWDAASGTVPRCPSCGAYLRPDVVWFEEPLSEAALAQAQAAAADCDLMIVAGTAAEVYPAAALPLMAKRAGAKLLEVNLRDTPLSGLADFVLRRSAGAALAALVEAAWGSAAMPPQSPGEAPREASTGGNGEK